MQRAGILVASLISCVLAQPAIAQSTNAPDDSPSREPYGAPTAGLSEPICRLIQSAAVANGLPVEFFARLIWQESRLKPNAVGPVTRSGARAQGIAQFMPATAAERSLNDPFDPGEALPKSAEFLRQLLVRFGNLGLAAAAYNAGPQRVRDWLDGKRQLPGETQSYVLSITGRSAQEWIRPGPKIWSASIPADIPCVGTVRTAAKPPSANTAAKPQIEAAAVAHNVMSGWAVQLAGDRTESKVWEIYWQLQKKYPTILAGYRPVVARTTLGRSTVAVWNRVRIEEESRERADSLCSRLRTAGGTCLVQRF